MNIKNIDFNMNYISYPYTDKKINTSKNCTKSCCNFSNELNRASNPAGSSNIDKIELKQHTPNDSKTLSDIRKNIVSDLSEDKNAQYIEKLKDQLNTDQYSINSSELAKILLYNSNK